MGQITTPWQGSLDGWQGSNGGGSTAGEFPQPASFKPAGNFSEGHPAPAPAPAAPPPTAPPPAQNQSSFGNPGWKPSYNAPGGYNPLQYASDGTANELAQGLGGTVSRTKTLGPFGDFGQNQIDFGNGNQLNAGLLADRYSKYDAATANAMTDAEKNAGPAVTNPNAGAIFMTGDPTKNSFHGGPGSEPQVTGPQPGAVYSPLMPGAQGQQPGGQGNQQNPLMQLLMLLGLGGQNRQQNRQPYANSGYYPNLPRGGNQMNPLTPPGQSQTSPPNGSTQAANPGMNPLTGRTGSFSPEMQQILANGPSSPTAFYNMNTGQWTDNGPDSGVLYAQGSGNQNSLSQQNVQRQLLSLLLGF